MIAFFIIVGLISVATFGLLPESRKTWAVIPVLISVPVTYWFCAWFILTFLGGVMLGMGRNPDAVRSLSNPLATVSFGSFCAVAVLYIIVIGFGIALTKTCFEWIVGL